MNRKDTLKKIKINDYLSYAIIDDTIYLFQDDGSKFLEELAIIRKKISLIILDNDINYINISAKNIENKKDFYRDLGFSLSYYDVNKLNYLFPNERDKISYRCYGIMTKSDFFDSINATKEDNDFVNSDVRIKSNAGYVSNLLLLFGGIILLCYFCIEGAIYLVK